MLKQMAQPSPSSAQLLWCRCHFPSLNTQNISIVAGDTATACSGSQDWGNGRMEQDLEVITFYFVILP